MIKEIHVVYYVLMEITYHPSNKADSARSGGSFRSKALA